MMKIWLVVFFSIWLSLNISVVQSHNWGLYKVGESMGIGCTNSQSHWLLGTRFVAECGNCQQPKCTTMDNYKDRIFATCDLQRRTSHITINSLKISDTSIIRCGRGGTVFYLYVGIYNKHFRPENNSPIALDQRQYTLVCDRDSNEEMAWYDTSSRYIGKFPPGKCGNIVSPSSPYASRIEFSCEQNVMKLNIKQIHLDSDDGSTIACRNGDKLYFFDIKVNVPVQRVTIQDPNGSILLEGQRRKFTCDSGRSKPAASIWWFLTYKNGSEIRILDSIKNEATPDGETFKTVSTLKLDLKREYQNVVCQAKIDNTSWKKSHSLQLHIKYPPSEITISQTSYLEGETTTLSYKLTGGNMAVKRVLWLPGNHNKESIQLKLNRNDNKKKYRCFVYLEGIKDPLSASILLNVKYPPSGITISQISYLEGETTTLSYKLTGGNIAVKRVLWLPGNHSEESIQLKLNRNDNKKKYTCFVYLEGIKDPLSASILLNVKYPPSEITISQTSYLEGETTTLSYKLTGGNMAVKRVLWLPGNHSEESIQLKLNRNDNKKKYTCFVYFEGIEDPLSASILLNVKYPPSEITISQTSYFEGETTTLSYKLTGGNMAVKRVLWLPGNHSEESIQLKLNRNDNKKMYECFVYFEGIEDPLWASILLNVEYEPYIKTNELKVIENRTQTINCEAEGNPTPKVQWIIEGTTFNSSVLNISLTRHVSNVSCVATANSSKYGLLQTVQRIAVFVSYPPEITMNSSATDLHQNAYVSCKAQAHPSEFVIKMVQKWGNTVKREICDDIVVFPNISIEDFGTWMCRVGNKVPSIDYYTESSVELQTPVQPLIKGNAIEMAMFGSSKTLKLCFYSYPDATNVQWFKDDKLISSSKYTFEPADDGLLPFPGNCSVLKVNTKERTIVHNFFLVITNDVGQSSLPVVLLIGQPDYIDPIIYQSIISALAVFIFYLLIAAVVYVKSRKKVKNIIAKTSDKHDSVCMDRI